MGVQVATARLGTAAALSASLPFAKAMGGVSASVALGAVLLCAGVLVYLVYCVMDKKEDASAAAVLFFSGSFQYFSQRISKINNPYFFPFRWSDNIFVFHAVVADTAFYAIMWQTVPPNTNRWKTECI